VIRCGIVRTADKALFSPPTYSARYVLFLLGVYRYESGCKDELRFYIFGRLFSRLFSRLFARSYLILDIWEASYGHDVA
jgi:hypothetical protein